MRYDGIDEGHLNRTERLGLAYRNHGWQHLYSFRARDADGKTEL